MTRTSNTSKTDCIMLTKYMAEVQLRIVEFTSGGMQLEGLKDDMHLKLAADKLKAYLEEYVK